MWNICTGDWGQFGIALTTWVCRIIQFKLFLPLLSGRQTNLTDSFSDDDPRITLHNKVLHAQHCNDLKADPTLPSTFGVKRTCLLNDLQYFHVSDNHAVDIMHDILEGVGQFELKLLFGYLSDNNIITKTDICNRI